MSIADTLRPTKHPKGKVIATGWVGFSDDQVFIETYGDPPAGKRIEVFKTRSAARKVFCDVRRVEIRSC